VSSIFLWAEFCIINIAKSSETFLRENADLKYKGIYFLQNIYEESWGRLLHGKCNSCYRFVLLLGHRKLQA
jgi:hypothetical protein